MECLQICTIISGFTETLLCKICNISGSRLADWDEKQILKFDIAPYHIDFHGEF